ncbi:hypothetical protein TWF281_007034 [Arthrobotrys megalospora]
MLKCNADNCLRAIRATNPVFSTRSQSADCTSFFKSYTPTVTAAAKVFTPVVISAVDGFGVAGCVPGSETAELPETPPPPGPPGPTMPAYATPCSGVVRFSSACACITATVSNPPSATTTTPTIIHTSTATALSYLLKVHDPNAEEALYVTKEDDPSGEYILPSTLTKDITKAITFFSHGDGLLDNNSGKPGFFNSVPDVDWAFIYYGTDDPNIYCIINENDFTVACDTGGANGLKSFAKGVLEDTPDVDPFLLIGKEGIDWAAEEVSLFGINAVGIRLEAVPIPATCTE